MISKYSIISNDNYAGIAVSSILDEMLSNIVGGDYIKHINIIIFSECSLWDVFQIHCGLDKTKHYILISNPRVFRVLSKTGVYDFIDISMPFSYIRNKLYSLIKHPGVYPFSSVVNVNDVFSYKEKLVLKYLLRGSCVTAIANITGIGVKSVSNKKVRVMNKLNVSSVQQLYIKLKCMGAI